MPLAADARPTGRWLPVAATAAAVRDVAATGAAVAAKADAKPAQIVKKDAVRTPPARPTCNVAEKGSLSSLFDVCCEKMRL
ncbi:hypothetical protein ATR1_039c0096 [Acetobacter tropicalis]|uniref:Uncharacterized protein n=1 Tax=Acetobacter tropicalis TaxID=104102 RepID=A0A511FP75_9PROT|nr:hypothetical protein [Acetobacter tropicalis]GAL96378.1 hypothetical protein ATR1_039c0096 [Acetobacter tropicalis]GEL50740.1 hypothetical protein ATR01nite_18150 [Acetobacter tropicalis]